ncbi:hypothetical protein K7432_011377 [Basidiobolus ranarum]|uniref:Uncharacterized protein n=1 Tax=Basidiobolus ranarum TaxID=34480 RepID=A0ABR2VU38_9FUNG
MSEDFTPSDSGYSSNSTGKFRSVSDAKSSHSTWSCHTATKVLSEFQIEETSERTSTYKLNSLDSVSPPSTSAFIPALKSGSDFDERSRDLKENEHKRKEETGFVWYCKVPPPPKCFPYHNNSVFLPNFYDTKPSNTNFTDKYSRSKTLSRKSSRESPKRGGPRLVTKLDKLNKGCTSLDGGRNTCLNQELHNTEKKRNRNCSLLNAANATTMENYPRKPFSFVQKFRDWIVTAAPMATLKRIPNNSQPVEQTQQRKKRRL